MKQDYFKVDTTECLQDSFKVLIENIKKYSQNINVFENGNFLYFNIQNIKDLGSYNKFISDFMFYQPFIESIEEQEFLKCVSAYDLRNDLLEV